jgi:hypothetical protein
MIMIWHTVAIAYLAALGYATDVNNTDLEPLRFTKNGTFQIAIFSDMHFGQCELHN